jgi:hypothetical protein
MRTRSGRSDAALATLSAPSHGLDPGVAGGGEEMAQVGAQILLVLDDKNSFAHVAPAVAAARTGSSMRNVEP